ncbi:hypothetical protein FGG08_001707 [Glutinoglossum americanum]|uniref:BZIP domain-containing protein n=1 Tax=Glutinoglossum americanum TaxID=1670608 RepID=A0A9P8IAU0_9PEZI|nr:hypothetical protein FGG08_001707 [Glutinoglossum americanum]
MIESPLPGPLNSRLASRSDSSRNTATISPSDALSFTTDNQQSWLSQSPSQQQRLMPASQLPPSVQDQDYPAHSPPTDFVLFPSSTARPARHSLEAAASVTANRTAPNQAYPQTSPGQGQNRRNSTQFTSVPSPVQNPRVTKIIHSTGHNTTSTSFTNRFSLPGAQKPQFYASSAPSSSPALFQQQQQQQSSPRPQVPLFHSNSTGNVHQQNLPRSRNMSMSNMPQGTLNQPCYTTAESLSTFDDTQLNDLHDTEMAPLFDLTSGDFDHDYAQDVALFGSANFSSPNFTSDPNASSMSMNQGTVSPKDLIRDPIASAPASTAFTNLTSPSIFDSPDIHDSYETSPWVNGADVDLDGGGPWFSLFPDQVGVNGESSEDSPPHQTEDIVNDALTSSAGPASHGRRRSSPGQSPGLRSASGKHSSISGVSSRKRDKPLPPIVVEDPHDTVAMKRARNTLAARKSRAKKVERFEELEKTIEDLKGEVEHWKGIALSRSGGQV